MGLFAVAIVTPARVAFFGYFPQSLERGELRIALPLLVGRDFRVALLPGERISVSRPQDMLGSVSRPRTTPRYFRPCSVPGVFGVILLRVPA